MVRRQILRSAACGLAFATSARAEVGHAQSQLVISARRVADLTIASRDGTGSFSFSALQGSGDAALDVAIADVLGRLSGVFELSPLFRPCFVDDSLRPTFAAMDGSVVDPSVAVHKGVVLLGRAFLGTLVDVHEGRRDGAAVAGSIAHELAHLYQFRSGWWDQMLGFDDNRSVRRAELHADFLAGWALAGQSGWMSLAGAEKFADALLAMGDYDFADPYHHGTPAQRFAAMSKGYAVGLRGLDLSKAGSSGMLFVNSLVTMLPEQ